MRKPQAICSWLNLILVSMMKLCISLKMTYKSQKHLFRNSDNIFKRLQRGKNHWKLTPFFDKKLAVGPIQMNKTKAMITIQ